MGFGDGDGAACKQCHAESRLSVSSMGKWYCRTQNQILLCAFLRGMACVSKAPHGNHHWGRSVYCRWLLLCANCPHGPKLRAICKKALRCCSTACAVVCSRSLSCDTVLQDLPHQMGLCICMQVQGPKISIFHIRILGFSRSQRSSTYIIAFFQLPHPSWLQDFAKTFTIRICGPIQAADTPILPPLFD